MKIGTSLRSTYPVDDPREGARWMVERAAAAAAAGLDSLFVGDHHATGPVPYYQNSPILSRLLVEWGDRPAGALYLLPAWNPVLVAEQVGTLAALAQGPFVLQCAVGGGDQMAAMGAPPKGRAAVFEDHLDVIRRLLAGEEVDGVRVAPVPPEPLQVWIGGHAPPAIDRAARLGDGWIAAPWATDEQAAEMAATYRKACEAYGRPPSAVVLRRDIHVGGDEAEARRVAQSVLDGGYRGMDPAATVVGSPDQVAERLAGYAAMGYDHVLVRHLAEDQKEVLASFARLARVRELVAGL
jgi:alkanesulfonate monooxygenase SsuD/methylene tetrahydromethanopterin reductase-like flavin-dependent oxidoreductase (luciferase family)